MDTPDIQLLTPQNAAQWNEVRALFTEYAEGLGISLCFQNFDEELTQLPEFRISIDRFLERANAKLERWETVKRYAVLDHELTVEDGGVTANMKLRRSAIAKRYADLVESLYDVEDED